MQTKRHSFIVSLLGIKHVVVAINKMDIVDYSQEVYDRIRGDYQGFAARLDLPDVHFLPISALKGDNVVTQSKNTPWYNGPTLMHLLETVYIGSDRNLEDFRFPVQHVLRPNLNFRGFCGHDRFGHRPQGRRDHGPAVAEDEPRQIDRHVRRRTRRSVQRRNRSRSRWKTKSTSAAAT